jgi:hypothetical protein
MPLYVIRRMRLAHCKRGPALCAECRAMDVVRICLLDVDPADAGLVQRRVIEIEVDGRPTWREFDVVRTFDSEEEAWRYAEREGIRDVVL